MHLTGVYSSGFYYQQEVNFRINASLDEKNHLINAFEVIEYINRSPDTLLFLYFHLWPNAYSGNNTALAQQLIKSGGRQKLYNDPLTKGYIDSLYFKANDREIKFTCLPGKPDICRIDLSLPLLPGDTLVLSTPFRVKIPEVMTSRLGYAGQAYHISQWFPKPAVYDRNGWHPMQYLDQGEYYSEFGKYEVSITVPNNYSVAATGSISKEISNEYRDSVTTITFIQENAHDFAWFAARNLRIDKDTVTLPSGKQVFTTVMFRKEYTDIWVDGIKHVNKALIYFSHLIGDYPYNTFTAVEGELGAGVGMEYPGLTIIGRVSDSYDLDDVIAHEVCHSWFYGALGSNERRFPFMDEGLTTAFEKRYMEEYYPERKPWQLYFRKEKIARLFDLDELTFRGIDELEWLISARRNLDMAATLSATEYNEEQYGRIVYGKAAKGFDYLRAFLGDTAFDTAMQQYYSEWKFRHPQPDDLRKAVESSTGKNLAWFFDDLLGTSKQVDYKISQLKGDSILVENKGNIASPLNIAGMKGKSADWIQWHEGFVKRKWIQIPDTHISSIRIDPFHYMPELYRINNNYKLNAIFPHSDPIDTKFYFKIEDQEKISLMYVPLPNWNRENGFMAGMALYNGLLLPERIEYFLVPFYSFQNKQPAGYGMLSLNIAPRRSLIRMAKITIDVSQFGAPAHQQYRKARAGTTAYFRKEHPEKRLQHSIYGYYSIASDPSDILSGTKAGMKSWIQIGYKTERSGPYDPFLFTMGFESGNTYNKVSALINYRYKYFRRNSGLDLRLFTGIMLNEDTAAPFYSFSPAGRSGREHYLYTGIFPDRFSLPGGSFWSKQMSLAEGSLISPVNDTLGFSKILLSFSTISNLPGFLSDLPFRPFFNVIMNDKSIAGNRPSVFYESGVVAGIRNFFELYIPVIVSPYISAFFPFRERIRFVLTLDTPLSLKVR